MRQTKRGFDEIRFRARGTVGLVVLGAFFGVVGWVWRATGGEADISMLWRVLSASAGNVYFWAVVGLCGVLGGWLAWLIFWRRQVHGGDADSGPAAGMRGPRF